MRWLIINADDFGLCSEVNAGVLDAFHAGSLTSTTLMVNAPAALEAARLAAANPRLGVGLHFNLTLGRPVLPAAEVPSLVDRGGQFHSRGQLARRLLTGRVSRTQVERELAAQYRHMQSLGLNPDHIDTHQHVHGFPLVFDTVAGFCVQHDLPMRIPWLLEMPGVRSRPGRAARQWLLRRMLARNVHKWQGQVRCNSGLGSLFDLGQPPAAPTLDDYRRVLQAAGSQAGVFELMVHPVRDARAVEGLTRIGAVSEAEWRVLSRPGLAALAQGMGFTLATYDILSPAAVRVT